MFVRGFLLIIAIATGFQPVLMALDCGRTPVEPILDANNLNVTEVKPHSWPWFALVCWRGLSDCSNAKNSYGVLIGAEWIMTSAVTANNVDDTYEIILGSHIKSTSQADTGNIKRNISGIYVHHNYEAKTNRYNVGLIKLDGPVTFTDYVQPVCIMEDPGTVNILGNTVYTIGHNYVPVTGSIKYFDPLLQIRAQFDNVSICSDLAAQYVFDDSFCITAENGFFDEYDASGFVRDEETQKWYYVAEATLGYRPPKPQPYNPVRCDEFVTNTAGSGICEAETTTTTTTTTTTVPTTARTTRSTAEAAPIIICMFVQLYFYFARFLLA